MYNILSSETVSLLEAREEAGAWNQHISVTVSTQNTSLKFKQYVRYELRVLQQVLNGILLRKKRKFLYEKTVNN